MTDLARRASDTTGPVSRALAAQRHDIITAQLRLHGAVRVGDLATLLDVSEMTVRRDLDALSELGVLDKVHGGATLRDDRSAFEPGFDTKSRRNLEEKIAISQRFESEVVPLFESGALRPVIHTRMPLTSSAAAHTLMESNANIGKILLDVR